MAGYTKLAIVAEGVRGKTFEKGGVVGVIDDGSKSKKKRKSERWVDIGGNKLKLVADTREGRPYKLLRIELYSKDGSTLIDTFHHQRGAKPVVS